MDEPDVPDADPDEPPPAVDTDPWTLERIVEERTDLAGLAQLHISLRDCAVRVEGRLAAGALHPRHDGPPAIHWLHGRPLFEAADRRPLLAPVITLFGGLAATLADGFPAVADAVGEMREAVAADAFPWDERIAGFRELPDASVVPHPELFRFLLFRALAVPLRHLALSASPPHPERWRRAACPFCGVHPIAQIAAAGSGRALMCVLCGGSWATADLACVACGEEDSSKALVLAGREAGPASLEACSTCRTALKVFPHALVEERPPLAAEVLTAALDLRAAELERIGRDETAMAAVFPPR